MLLPLKILIQPLVALLIPFLHPFYVSVIEIRHNETTASAEISVRIFTEDLEQTLRKQTNSQVDLVYPKNKTAADKLVNDYIRKKNTINHQWETLRYAVCWI